MLFVVLAGCRGDWRSAGIKTCQRINSLNGDIFGALNAQHDPVLRDAENPDSNGSLADVTDYTFCCPLCRDQHSRFLSRKTSLVPHSASW